MTFPFTFHENFETGGKGSFDSESDSGNRLDFPGPDQIGTGTVQVFPHRGAYCARINMGKNSTNAILSETVTWNADSTNYVAFKFMIGDDIEVGNDGDLVDIFYLWNGSAFEGHVTLARIEPAGLVLGLRDVSGTVNDYVKVEPGDWYCVELQVDIDAGGGNDGTIIMRIGDSQVTLSNLDQAAVTTIAFGAANQSGDWKGHIYFDDIMVDTARLHQDYGPDNVNLDGQTLAIFKSGWAFVGEGTVMGLELVDGGSNDCTMKVYDTSELAFSEAMKKAHLATSTSVRVDRAQALGDTPLFPCNWGCYVSLAGTNPSAFVRIGSVGGNVWDDDDGDE